MFILNKGIDYKAPLRALGENRRAEAAEKHPTAANHAASHFMRALDPQPDQIIALYVPFDNELETWPLVEALTFQGNTICLPVVTKKNAPLTFRLYEVDTPLVDGMFGIKTPPENATTVIPDIIICPLVGWRKDGTRLGMGGGFYDRTLEKLRAQKKVIAIGFGYSLQELKAISPEPHDQQMDWIVTEQGAIRV